MKQYLDPILQQVVNSLGQLVLASQVDYKFHGCTGFGYSPSPEDYTRDQDIWLGVIRDGAPIGTTDPPSLTIPVVKTVYARTYTSYRPEYFDHINKFQLEFGWFQLAGFDEFVESPAKRYRDNKPEPEPMFEVAVGDKAVFDWFETQAAREADRYILARIEDVQDIWRLRRQRLCEEAGKLLEEPVLLDAAKARSRTQLLSELKDLRYERETIIKRLDRIRQTPKRGGVMREGGAISLVEDDDDVRVRSMGPKRDLDRVESKIRSSLDQLKKLGAESEPIFIELSQELEM